MCDTMVIVRPEGVLFAKNSDRDANEAQNIEWHPRARYESGEKLKCTWIEIPQVRETNATFLCRPFWMWGAEIGANEHGVAIGNESVFTKEPYEKKPGLLGMDMVRLALERADTAEAAVGVITSLLEQYGQGGGAGYEDKNFVYHNSFIVADPTTAFVVETAGRKWTTEEVQGPRSISNRLTIPEFYEEHTDFLYTKFASGLEREARTQSLIDSGTSIGDMVPALCDHGTGNTHPKYSLINGGLAAPCVHASGLFAASQTTSTLMGDLRPGNHQFWASGTSTPCTSLFKPIRVNEPIDIGARAEEHVNDSLWWRHEQFQRAVLRNPAELMPLFAAERATVQARWFENPPESAQAFAEADELLAKWHRAVQEKTVRDIRPLWVRRYWRKRNHRVGCA